MMGKEALEYVLTEDYDLIVLDLNLPGHGWNGIF